MPYRQRHGSHTEMRTEGQKGQVARTLLVCGLLYWLRRGRNLKCRYKELIRTRVCKGGGNRAPIRRNRKQIPWSRRGD